ncbi:MAG: PaaI family thioesterase [Acidimicrobiia bacterium]
MPLLDQSIPVYALMGLDLEIEAGGRAVGRMTVTEQHYSQAERMHGGLVFVAFDTVMGGAVRSLIEPGTDIATIDISMRFIRMVYTGELRVEAEVYHPGRRVMQVRADAFEHRGKLAATATGAFVVLGDH